MRIVCDLHEPGIGIHVSPDLAVCLRLGAPFPTCREFTYLCDGEPYLRLVMSDAFAEPAGVSAGAAELPDDYPDWFKRLVPACQDCVDAAMSATSSPN